MPTIFIIRNIFNNEQISPSLKSSLPSVSVVCVILCSVALLTFGTPFIFYIHLLNFVLMECKLFDSMYVHCEKDF